MRSLLRLGRHPLAGSVLMAACGLVACGGKVVVDGATDGGLTCAAATSACTLAGSQPPADACGQCVAASICACRSLNTPDAWSVPSACMQSARGCTGSAEMATDPTCQVAAVEMVWCFIESSHPACSTAYFAANPQGAIEPLGMELALYGCAVCDACGAACAGTPNADFCDGI